VMMLNAQDKTKAPTGGPVRLRRFFVALCVAVGVVVVYQYVAQERQLPDYRQKIYAALVSWGVSIDGVVLPVSREDIDRHIALLWSDDGEHRVEAAAWLASRGVQEAGPAIAASMKDEGTYRPCQLAHSLGFLGDDRWVAPLADAIQDPRNADLRVCATIALGELGSAKAVDVLIGAHRQGTVGSLALTALSNIADPSALPYLHSVVQAPRNKIERRAAEEAIERIALVQQDDPVPFLIDRVRRSAKFGPLDDWAVKKLVGLGDPRAIRAFERAFQDVGLDRDDDLVVLAAAMLAQGQGGLSAIRGLALAPSRSGASRSEIAQAAWALGNNVLAFRMPPANAAPVAQKQPG